MYHDVAGVVLDSLTEGSNIISQKVTNHYRLFLKDSELFVKGTMSRDLSLFSSVLVRILENFLIYFVRSHPECHMSKYKGICYVRSNSAESQTPRTLEYHAVRLRKVSNTVEFDCVESRIPSCQTPQNPAAQGLEEFL